MEATSLSVVLVTRNRASLLTMALAHLEQQTFPAARFEIVLVDAGSTDGTPEVMQRYAAGAPVRIRTLRTEDTNTSRARNTAIKTATGRWVLFLDDDLLAGPGLVESHVAAQERAGGECAVIGKVDMHPQADTKVFLGERELGRRRNFLKDQPLRFLDWRLWNLSLPRNLLIEAGGFDEEFSVSGLDDIELANRLEQQGLRGYYCDDACAYLWMPLNLEEQRRRYYAEGHTLPRVMEKTQSDMVRNRYLGPLRWGLPGPAQVMLPVYRRACMLLASNTRPFGYMCRRILMHAMREGYRDALRG
ncbi:MAG: glycosyltransferase, partial [Candidatus Hydrogenedentes bacterium]|nr:glycosyltransferase [Candidatus Hydrogenedentota bacterium]